MQRYVLARFIQVVATLFGVTVIAFVATSALGDPSYFVLGESATPEAVQAYRMEHGLDRPLWTQYAEFVTNALHGDLGSSFIYREPAAQVVADRLPATLSLGGSALAIAVLLGIPLGTVAAQRRGGIVDQAISALALIGQAIPGFFLGLLLIIVFAVDLHLLPTGGAGSWKHLVLPAFTLAAYLITLIVRMTRSSVIDVLGQDYIRTARAKGLGERRVLFVHVSRNVLIAMVTVVGLQMSVLFSGAVVTETIFGWPGVGRLVVQAVGSRDLPVLRAAVLIISTAVVLLNVCVDVLYGVIDPRIKLR